MMTIKSIEVEHLTNIHTTLSEKDIEWMKRNEEVWLYYQEATLEEIMLLEENTMPSEEEIEQMKRYDEAVSLHYQEPDPEDTMFLEEEMKWRQPYETYYEDENWLHLKNGEPYFVQKVKKEQELYLNITDSTPEYITQSFDELLLTNSSEGITICKENLLRLNTDNSFLVESLEINDLNIIQQNSPATIIPNQVMKAMTGKQKGLLQDVRKNADTIKALLKSLIKNNTSITYEQKKEQIEQIECGDISFQMDCYLGANFTIYEIVFIRAIEVIVSKMISAGEIGNHFGLIYIPWYKIYEECGIAPRPEGGYEWKASKKIRDVLKEGGNLRKTILEKNEFEQQIMDTSFILETQLRTTKEINHKVDSETKTKSEIEETQNIGVGLRLSSFLFFTPDYEAKLKMCTLMDNQGFIRFRKINKTKLGFSLFIWLERYISQHDKTKTLDLNTIIVNLNLVKEYKNKPKRTKEDIERAFNDMIEQKTLITAFKKENGAKGQEQYIFTNARYKPAPHKSNNKKSTESFH
jgi:hypothetical protein